MIISKVIKVGVSIAAFGLLATPLAFAAQTGTSTMTVTLPDVISLSILPAETADEEISEVTIEIPPDGRVHTKDVYVRVGTNAVNGYKLNLEMIGDTTDLIMEGASKQIVPTTTAELDMNSWGYSLDATSFSSVPANGNAVEINSGDKTTTDEDAEAYEDTPVTFGAKVNTAIAQGIYSNSVIFTAVANE